MSYNGQYVLTREEAEEISRATASGLMQKHIKVTTWYNPEDEWFYGADDAGAMEPVYDKRNRIANAKQVGMGQHQIRSAGLTGNPLSSTEMDKALFSGIKREFLDQAVRLRSDMEAVRTRGSGIITAQSYPELANIMVDTAFLELIARDYILQQAVTTKPWSKIEYTGYNFTPYRNQGNLGENDLIDAREGAYVKITAKLKKAQGHVAASKWAELAIRDRPFVDDNFSIINADFPRIFNEEIAAALTQFGNLAAVGGVFDAVGAGEFHSTAKPTNTFRPASSTIRTTGGAANTMAMNGKTFQVLQQNTWMRTGAVVFGAIPGLENSGSRTATHPLLPGYAIFIDESLPDGVIYQYWKEGIMFLKGPTRTSTVDDNLKWKVSQVVDQWYGSIVRNTSLGVEITGTVT